MRRTASVAIAVFVSACGVNSDAPIFAWSDDGACGVPAGYVGLDETPTADGGCSAATWCPIDSSPNCVSPPPDAGAE
jgi:hypothetical protein